MFVLNLYKIDLVNLAAEGASLNDVITWNGTQWAPAPGGGGGNPLVTDIQQTGATLNQVIQWNGSTWTPATIGGTGTVTSVGLSLPSLFSVSGSPVTISGTLTASLVSQTANQVFAGPASGGPASPTFRVLVAADIPTIPSAGVSGLAAIATSGSATDLIAGTVDNARLASSYAAISALPSLGQISETLQLGGTTNAFPSLRRGGPNLVARLADDSGNTGLTAANIALDTAGYIIFAGRGGLKPNGADGILELTNSTDTDFNRLLLGGSTSAFPSIKRNGAGITARLADDSADTTVTASQTQITGPFIGMDWFGNGEDGDFTFSTAAGTPDWASKSGGRYTLTRDVYLNNLTWDTGGILITDGFRLHVNGVLDLTNAPSDTIRSRLQTSMNGGSTTTGTAGTVPTALSTTRPLPYGVIGVVGRAGLTGVGPNGTAGSGIGVANSRLVHPVAGAGGAGVSAGGTSGSAGSVTSLCLDRRLTTMFMRQTTPTQGGPSGRGGGAGGGNGVQVGGGSGGSGSSSPVLWIGAREINFTGAGTGVINNQGGNGGNGGNGQGANAGGGGGSGGGSSSGIYLVWQNLTVASPSDTVQSQGGEGGTGGDANTTGTGGAGGHSGNSGTIMGFNLRTQVVTTVVEVIGVAGSAASGITGGAGAPLNTISFTPV